MDKIKTKEISTDISEAVNDIRNAIAVAKRDTNADAQRAITGEVMKKMTELVAELKDLFEDYSATFSPPERNRLVGVGIKNYGFIQNALDSAVANEQFLPRFFDNELFKEAVKDFEDKRLLLAALRQFEQEVSDSMLGTGDMAYRYALTYYNSLKEAARQKIKGAEAEYKRLSAYFKSKNRYKSSEPTEKEIERDIRSLLHGTKDGKVVVENERPAVSAGKRRVIDEVD